MGRRPTVLVVDDSPAYLRLVQYILEEAGYRVVTARDGDEALSRAVHDQPDLIACDILLPRRDGLAVLQALKQRPETRDIPVYIFSSLGDEEYIAQAYAAGAVGREPVSTGRLVDEKSAHLLPVAGHRRTNDDALPAHPPEPGRGQRPHGAVGEELKTAGRRRSPKRRRRVQFRGCLLYTSDAADE